jgi:anti-sigma factor RsiW
MSEPKEGFQEVELLIEDYLDDRMTPEQRARFEERVRKDPELRNRLDTATRSVALVQQALGWLTPGEEFEEKVNTKIVSVTQSWQNLQPYLGSSSRSLTSEDADAQLLADPEAAREKRRLIVLAVVAALLFLLAASAIGYSIAMGVQKPEKPVPEENQKTEKTQ